MNRKFLRMSASAIGGLALAAVSFIPSAFAATGYVSNSNQKTNTEWLSAGSSLIREYVTTKALISFNVASTNSTSTDITNENISIDVIDSAGEPFSIYPYANKIAWYSGSTYQYSDYPSTPGTYVYSPSDTVVGYEQSYSSYTIPTSWQADGQTGYTTTETSPGAGTNDVWFSAW